MVAEPSTRYGFIGLGQMGYGMALNLRKKIPKSSSLVISELNEERRSQFIKAADGEVTIAGNPVEVVAQSDVVITMLPQGKHVFEVFCNEKDGLLALPTTGNPNKRIFIDCSTIYVGISQKVSEKVKASNLGTFVDAPVSGGPNGANSGTLTIMVGGTNENFGNVQPVLAMMGKNVTYCGPSGAGLATKQINNYLSSVCTIGTCEAMNMGIKYGLDPKVLAGAINGSSGRCYNSLEQKPVKGVTLGAASEKDFEGGFSVELCKGVLDMVSSLRSELGVPSVLLERVLGVYEKAIKDERCQGKDSRSVFRLFADGDLT